MAPAGEEHGVKNHIGQHLKVLVSVAPNPRDRPLLFCDLFEAPIQGKPGEAEILGGSRFIVVRQPKHFLNDRMLDISQGLFP
jgi:hypothetical protein